MNNVINIFGENETKEEFAQKVAKKIMDWDGFDKLILIGLNDSGGKYDIKMTSHGMKYSEGVSLLDIVKDDLKREMGL